MSAQSYPFKELVNCSKHLNVRHCCGLDLASSQDKISPQCRDHLSPVSRHCLVEIYPTKWIFLHKARFLYVRELRTSTSSIRCMRKLPRTSAPVNLLLQSYDWLTSLCRQQVLLGWAAPLRLRQHRLHRRFSSGSCSTGPSEEMSSPTNLFGCSLIFRVIIQLVKLHRQCMPAAKRS